MTDPVRHPSDDDLVLLFYGECSDDAQADLRAHLDRCSECRVTYNEITRTLHLSSSFQAPDPGQDFEARVWQRVMPVAGTAGRWPWWSIAALAASVTVAAAAGWTWMERRSTSPAAPVATGTTDIGMDPRERVLFAAVDEHLVQTEVLFVELLNSPVDASDALEYMKLTADDLVASGRLYRETARQTGALHLVSVLDDVEPVLVQVARTGDAVDARDLRALQGRIEEDDLLFKVRAVSAELQEQQEEDDRTTSDEGAL